MNALFTRLQRLNASIAMYVTGQTQLIRDGVINRDEFRLLAERAMVINPSAEVYLLDTRGRILAHALPPGSVRSLSVGLAPIRALVSGEREPPVYADDPMNPGRRKVFSAAPVMDGGSLQGYLYVVLGGRQYDALADSVHASYARKSTLVAMGSLLAAAVLAGLCVFAFLTRRLTRLARVVESFSASALQSPPDSQASNRSWSLSPPSPAMPTRRGGPARSRHRCARRRWRSSVRIC